MAVTMKKPPSLTGSQDLLSYFKLIPIYNKFVKPYPPPNRAEGLDPTLFPYISDLPGKLDLEPDNYLFNLLRDPQAVESGPEIKPLDLDTLKDAFSLKEGPIPGFDASILGTDDACYVDYSLSYGQNTADRENINSLIEYDQNGERKHKKKKKKRKHGHEHDEEGHNHGDHKKKKKKKKDKERGNDYNTESLMID